jgi:ribosomal protein S19
MAATVCAGDLYKLRSQLKFKPFRSSVFVPKRSMDMVEPLKIFGRSSTISKDLLNRWVVIYNGFRHRKPIPVLIRDNMVGHKFGEFSLTKHKRYPIHRHNRVLMKKQKREREKDRVKTSQANKSGGKRGKKKLIPATRKRKKVGKPSSVQKKPAQHRKKSR